MPDSNQKPANHKPRVAMLLSPETRVQVMSDAAAVRLAAVADFDFPAPGELVSANLEKLIAGASVAIAGWGTPPITAEMLAANPGLKLVVHSAGSVRRLVPGDAIESGTLKVSHAAIHIAEAVAEFVLTQMLMHLRMPQLHDKGMKAGEPWFGLREQKLGRLLGSQTVGLVGAGYVGRLVIGQVRAFGAKILVADPYLSPDRATELGVEIADLETLLRDSDIVSLHAPVLPETHHMIGAEQLAMLKDGALFINTARAALVDELALLQALESGRFTAAIDVFENEPLPADSRFRTVSNIILSPHAAGHTFETRLRQGDTAVTEALRFLAGEPLRHEVTRAMLANMA